MPASLIYRRFAVPTPRLIMVSGVIPVEVRLRRNELQLAPLHGLKRPTRGGTRDSAAADSSRAEDHNVEHGRLVFERREKSTRGQRTIPW